MLSFTSLYSRATPSGFNSIKPAAIIRRHANDSILDTGPMFEESFAIVSTRMIFHDFSGTQTSI